MKTGSGVSAAPFMAGLLAASVEMTGLGWVKESNGKKQVLRG
jgi:hypothetical protein